MHICVHTEAAFEMATVAQRVLEPHMCVGGRWAHVQSIVGPTQLICGRLAAGVLSWASRRADFPGHPAWPLDVGATGQHESAAGHGCPILCIRWCVATAVHQARPSGGRLHLCSTVGIDEQDALCRPAELKYVLSVTRKQKSVWID